MSFLRRVLGTKSNATAPKAAALTAQAMSRNESEQLVATEAQRSSVVGAALALTSTGEYGKALAIIDQALAVVPGDPELYFARGAILTDWGRLCDAHEEYLRGGSHGLGSGPLFVPVG